MDIKEFYKQDELKVKEIYEKIDSEHKIETKMESRLQNGWTAEDIEELLDRSDYYTKLIEDENDYKRCIRKGDFIYTYYSDFCAENGINNDIKISGWEIRVRPDRKHRTKYEIPYSFDFLDAPVISISHCFEGCYNLSEAPNSYRFGNDVLFANSTYKGCWQLKKLPSLPYSILYMEHCFENCYSIAQEGEYHLPSKVINIDYAFANCLIDKNIMSLKESLFNYGCGPECHNKKAKEMILDFVMNTYRLPKLIIPDTVVSMDGLCFGSVQLHEIDIPKNVEYANNVFGLYYDWYIHNELDECPFISFMTKPIKLPKTIKEFSTAVIGADLDIRNFTLETLAEDKIIVSGKTYKVKNKYDTKEVDVKKKFHSSKKAIEYLNSLIEDSFSKEMKKYSFQKYGRYSCRHYWGMDYETIIRKTTIYGNVSCLLESNGIEVPEKYRDNQIADLEEKLQILKGNTPFEL